ncbi:MAG: 3-phosphoshikimate 1-carboxyvinyltransferase [Gammaproteobacteria bacterium]|nr:3-phosphoshikimate 1-carboxyvinyltransferase [Gammaproteobacteria bacterium]NNC98066.1 3-phosphoshikimate 1-carboxyvinyltransferase [Gammaproteobacteria bacterium]NNM14616.1 3-phosphoshikimate 1-carboxyvinyltransferase [Gammaproteobacteria bacterium]
MSKSILFNAKSKPLAGTLRVPGDKSITQRAYIFGAMAEGITTVHHPLNSADAEATLQAVIDLGATLVEKTDDMVVIKGVGQKGFTAPDSGMIDCQNSGTGMRLLCGAVAGQNIEISLSGDASLNKRPMERVAVPLRGMGASVTTEDGKPPIKIHGGGLHGIEYHSGVASAQVKSCVLLAGLQANGQTTLVEPQRSRDHTEKMLPSFGVQLESTIIETTGANRVVIQGGQKLAGTDVTVPADPSSAAFILVAAALVPDSDVILNEVGMSPPRTGLIRALRKMGARIEIQNSRFLGQEPVADLRISHSKLNPVHINPAEVSDMVDEIPVLMLAASLTEGESVFEGLHELRVKESDRLGLMIDNLKAIGVDCEISAGDGAVIRGKQQLPMLEAPADWQVAHDHRLAMTGMVAALVSPSRINVLEPKAVDVSWPAFLADLESLMA